MDIADAVDHVILSFDRLATSANAVTLVSLSDDLFEAIRNLKNIREQ